MEKRFEKGSKERQFFVDYYKFIQDFYIPEKEDTWWGKLHHEAVILSKKYGNSEYVRELITAHINRLERVNKNGMQCNKGI